MKTIELDVELVDNGAIIRHPDDKGCQYVEVVEGKDDDVARFIGAFITTEMDYDSELKAKVKIEIEYEDRNEV